MKTVFASALKPLLDAMAQKMAVYTPEKVGEHFVFGPYDGASPAEVCFNNVRACTPVKELLFPLRELAAVYPRQTNTPDYQPFAVFGLKECDLRSIQILDQVFLEEDLPDLLYEARRDRMFVVGSDCFEPTESCFCAALGGKGYASEGYDLNVTRVKDGYLIQAGSEKGADFLAGHAHLFAGAPDSLCGEREKTRAEVAQQLQRQIDGLESGDFYKEAVEAGYDSPVFDEEARSCVECQGCTRICPTCHCFYLYDTKRDHYFGKMKMWDSCMRMAYAEVAGGGNPRNVLGDRLRHRFMHKFVYFPDRYGLQMCVGCGRCVDAEAGAVDIRAVLEKLNNHLEALQTEESK